MTIGVASLLSALLAAQPASAGEQSGPWPTGTYRSVHLTGDAAPGTSITLTVGPDDTIGFTAGCNDYAGHGVIRHGHLQLTDDLIGTLKLCADDLMRTEAWFGGLLTSAPAVESRGGRLTLDGAPGTATFTKGYRQ